MFKKNTGNKLLVVVSLFFIALLLFAGQVCAQNGTVINEDINKAVGDLDIPRGTTVNGDVTLNIGELDVMGVINGNVNSNMGQVTIGGDVNGNVETNMGQVLITGNVSGNVKTRMGEVIIDGSVGGNVDSDLGSARIGGSVGGDIGSGFGELSITGTVAGDVNSKGGNIIITGVVEGDVILEQGLVELGPNAIVSGRISVARGMVEKADTAMVGTVEVGEELTFAELEEVEGDNGYSFEGVDSNFVDNIAERIVNEVNRGFRSVNFPPRMNRDWSFYRSPFMNFYGHTARGIINMLILFALAALTYTLFPKQVRATGAAVPNKPGPVIGWGILVAVLSVPLMVLLAITIIGIPLIIVEIIFLAAVVILGYSGIALLVGNKIIAAASSKSANPLGAIALGVLILGLVGMVPILGGLVTLALFILAVGTALVTRFGTIKPEASVMLPAAEEADEPEKE